MQVRGHAAETESMCGICATVYALGFMVNVNTSSKNTTPWLYSCVDVRVW